MRKIQTFVVVSFLFILGVALAFAVRDFIEPRTAEARPWGMHDAAGVIRVMKELDSCVGFCQPGAFGNAQCASCSTGSVCLAFETGIGNRGRCSGGVGGQP